MVRMVQEIVVVSSEPSHIRKRRGRKGEAQRETERETDRQADRERGGGDRETELKYRQADRQTKI